MVLRGRVVESGAGTAVAGAEVRAVCHSVSAVTASDGTWALRVPAGAHEITVEHLAYADRSVHVEAGETAALMVRLTPRPVSLSELVVTASRRLQELKDVPVATEVVGRDEIERSGAADLSAVLVEHTGIGAEGGHPVGAGVMLQGLGAERVLVLVDGQPFIGRISGGLDVSRIPTSMIERVEVVKGPQSTLYGSEAMGGVVNIITRAPARSARRATIRAVGGSHGRLDLATGMLGSAGSVAYAADGGRRTIELVPGHAGDAGTFATRWDGSARVQWQAAPSLLLNAGALLLDESQRWSSGPLYYFADNLQWGGRIGAVHTSGAHSFSPTLYATEFRHLARRSTLPEPVASASDETEVQRLVEAELLYTHATERLAIDAGIEARRESIHSDRVTGADRQLHTLEPFTQVTWSGGAWSVVPGIRMSWSEQWGVHLTPRIAAMVRPTERLALRASLGQGFRAPSFKELYMEFLNTGAGAGYRVRGNPDLRPETSNNVSGSIEWSGDRLYSRVQLFYNRFDEFIETREVPDDGDITLFEYGNIDDGETYGAELELGATWGGLSAEAGYSWLRALNRATGDALLGRPTHSARTSLAYALPFGLRASLSGVYTGATPTTRTDDGAVVTRAALTRFDVRASQALPRGFELSAGLDNVLDATLAGYPGFLGRQMYVGLTWFAGRGPQTR
ncbi:MAG TPA: TonB-dependent receptor [Longimicrobiales bacterium]|nr:TonB-dependent receptor [Longimicrobiales bacterium]